jgi:hypothetical protein
VEWAVPTNLHIKTRLEIFPILRFCPCRPRSARVTESPCVRPAASTLSGVVRSQAPAEASMLSPQRGLCQRCSPATATSRCCARGSRCPTLITLCVRACARRP